MAQAGQAKDHAEQTLLLERIARLLALLLIKGEPQARQMILLSSAGYAPKAIADLLGTTPNTVSVRLSEFKRRQK